MISSLASIPIAFLQTLSLRDLFFQWQDAGIFDFLLPVILIFAVVFGILTSTNILGGQRGINFLVSIALALLAMQYAFVSDFFALIFPNLGIALAILLAVLVMAGLFIGEENKREWFNIVGYGAFGIGIIVAIVTLNQVDWFGSWWWQNNWVNTLWIVVLVLIVWPLLLGPKKETKDKPLTLKALRE